MEKYLRNYAEPETCRLDDLIRGVTHLEPWANVLVIPACNESSRFLRPPPPTGGRSLLVLVINQSAAASPEVRSVNASLAAAVREKFEPRWQSAGGSPGSGAGFGLELLRDPLAERDVLLVDRFSDGRQLPVKGGVGHARKIGADLAAGLIHRKRILSRWIHCSDADVRLPDTYFLSCNAASIQGAELAAVVYPFHHRGTEESAKQRHVDLATRLYEISLHYYVAGLKYAGSPYAFHTIGSTMAVDAGCYAKVRGFPKREAGEDFYLLNKLAKVGAVRELESGPGCEAIEIEARRSDRVPFGTGAAVNTITGLEDPAGDFRFYHPAVFDCLRAWLQSWPAIWRSGSSDIGAVMRHLVMEENDPDLRLALLAGLETIGTGAGLEHAFRQSRDFDQFRQQMQTWFDAFRTLKLLHFLRDHHLPSVGFETLADSPLFGHLFLKAAGNLHPVESR